MVAVSRLRPVGNQLVAQYTDGSQVLFLPTGSDTWLPTTAKTTTPGSGGEVSNPGTGGTPGTVAAAVDDYPWPTAPENDMSPLRYSYRDCTDFVAWRCNRHAGVTAAPWQWTWGNLRWQGPTGNGNAIGWRADWISYGRAVDLPVAADLIAWFGTKVGTYGHVAYVQKVNTDLSIVLEEYNWGYSSDPNGTQRYDTRTVAPGSAYYPDSFLAMP
jgi:surface antigen